MIISKNEYDESYPYVISNTWGEEISCDLEDLLNLKKSIEEILKTNNPKESKDEHEIEYWDKEVPTIIEADKVERRDKKCK